MLPCPPQSQINRFSGFVVKHSDQNNLGREGLVSAYISRDSPSLREIKAETQAGTVESKTRAADWLAPGSY